jgi:nucleoid-associated protein YgaU
MISRYDKRAVLVNDHNIYDEIFFKKNVKSIKQYSTPQQSDYRNEIYSSLVIIPHVWVYGDRFYKLSQKYYGDPRDWWIISKFNKIPTEFHVKLNQEILIPKPLNLVLDYLRE